ETARLETGIDNVMLTSAGAAVLAQESVRRRGARRVRMDQGTTLTRSCVLSNCWCPRPGALHFLDNTYGHQYAHGACWGWEIHGVMMTSATCSRQVSR